MVEGGYGGESATIRERATRRERATIYERRVARVGD